MSGKYKTAVLIAYTIAVIDCCSLPQNMPQYTYQHYTISTTTKTLLKSKSLIDRTTTYELLLELTEDTPCIELMVIATDAYNKRVRCAFILDKAIDTSKYPGMAKQQVYSEIARNFDANWRFQSKITACTNRNDPLKRITKGVYRLRISAFSITYYQFDIDISSNVPIAFLPKQ
ncbi:MAG: hypothetical protein ACUVRK_11210 [Spirochaetota bacterium]